MIPYNGESHHLQYQHHLIHRFGQPAVVLKVTIHCWELQQAAHFSPLTLTLYLLGTPRIVWISVGWQQPSGGQCYRANEKIFCWSQWWGAPTNFVHVLVVLPLILSRLVLQNINYLEKFKLKKQHSFARYSNKYNSYRKMSKVGRSTPMKAFFSDWSLSNAQDTGFKIFKNSAITSKSVVVKGTISSQSK